jgi:hypothetical protein
LKGVAAATPGIAFAGPFDKLLFTAEFFGSGFSRESPIKNLATGGRPSECWFPDVAPQPVVITPATPAVECPVEAEQGVAGATPAPAPAHGC